MAAALSACGHRASNGSTSLADSLSTDSVACATSADDDSLYVEVKTIKYSKSDSTAEASVMVQWPVKGGKAIVDSLQKNINSWICAEIKTPKDIHDYGKSLFESLSMDWHSVYDEMPSEDRLGAFTKNYEVTLETQTKYYVTYFFRQHEYQGGVHGYTTDVGFTFRKTDGKQIQLLKDVDSPRMAKLIKQGVKSFFAGEGKTMTDKEVLEYLFAEEVSALNHLPLPLNAPYLTKTGVVFLYTQYEIAPYSSGIITFEVPFEQIKPFLTKEALELIK